MSEDEVRDDADMMEDEEEEEKGWCRNWLILWFVNKAFAGDAKNVGLDSRQAIAVMSIPRGECNCFWW